MEPENIELAEINEEKSHFPIRILLTEKIKDGMEYETMICETPEDIPGDQMFKVLELNVKVST